MDEGQAVSDIRKRPEIPGDPRLDQVLVFVVPEPLRPPFVLPDGAFKAMIYCGHGHLFEARVVGASQVPDFCPYCNGGV